MKINTEFDVEDDVDDNNDDVNDDAHDAKADLRRSKRPTKRIKYDTLLSNSCDESDDSSESSDSVDEDDLCKICDERFPPSKRHKKPASTSMFGWIFCDSCERWMHNECEVSTEEDRALEQYECRGCKLNFKYKTNF